MALLRKCVLLITLLSASVVSIPAQEPSIDCETCIFWYFLGCLETCRICADRGLGWQTYYCAVGDCVYYYVWGCCNGNECPNG